MEFDWGRHWISLHILCKIDPKDRSQSIVIYTIVKMADLEAVLADVSYLMAMEKSKSTPAARASKKIILPDPRYVAKAQTGTCSGHVKTKFLVDANRLHHIICLY